MEHKRSRVAAESLSHLQISRHDPEGIHLLTVDHGVFPEDTVRLLHPLDEPSKLDSAVDIRRIRAFTIAALEDAAASGHTLHFAGSLSEAIREIAVRPECPVTADILSAGVREMAPEVIAVEMKSDLALQLGRYQTIGELIRKQVLGRISGQRHAIQLDWAKILDSKLPPMEMLDPAEKAIEQRARNEKAMSLAELAESRFSVLAGPAGAGEDLAARYIMRSKGDPR